MKFKVDDWVKTLSGETKQVTGFSEEQGSTIIHSDGFMCYASDCKLWQPEPNEYILATDDTRVYLVQFLGMNYEKFVCAHLDGFSETFTKIEPFIGELPSFLKE